MEPLEPMTLAHFQAFAGRLILDTGDPWVLEDFQLQMFEPILSGIRETWTIIPEGNGKSTGWAAFGLYHCMFTRLPWVPVIAAARDQAEIMAQQAYGIIRSTPGLEWDKRSRTGYFEILEGYKVIRCYQNGMVNGRGIKVYAADVNTSDGGIPTLVLCDEGHRWASLQPYRLWKGKLGKRKDLKHGGGQIAMTSTAGEPGGEFEEQREAIRRMATSEEIDGCHRRYEGFGMVMNEWMLSDPKDAANMEKVKEANPFSGITIETLQDQFNSPTTDLGDWKRLKCNLPARTSAAAITEVEWAEAGVDKDVPEGGLVDIGVDVAWKHDTFAIVPLWRFEPGEDDLEEKGYRLLGTPSILVPPRDGSTMHPDEVKEAIRALHDYSPIQTAVIDLERAEDIAAWMEDELQITVVDRAQGNVDAVADYDAFMKALRSGALKHNRDRTLRQHVMNAIARRMPGDKYRFDRPSQSRAKRRQVVRVIDGLTAAAMVNRYAEEDYDFGEPLVAWR